MKTRIHAAPAVKGLKVQLFISDITERFMVALEKSPSIMVLGSISPGFKEPLSLLKIGEQHHKPLIKVVWDSKHQKGQTLPC